MRSRTLAGTLALATLAVAPAAAQAQYTAPPPDPGYSYIFDGSATGSDASFDKWAFAAGTAAQSRPASQGGQGQATLDPVEGSFLVGASPFGASCASPHTLEGLDHGPQARLGGRVHCLDAGGAVDVDHGGDPVAPGV